MIVHYRNCRQLADGTICGEQWNEFPDQPAQRTIQVTYQAADGTVKEKSLVIDHTKPSWHKFSGIPALMKIHHIQSVVADSTERFWQIQDGYGPRGFTPEQGYDWSGIRDSSPAALREMEALADQYAVHYQIQWPWLAPEAQAAGTEP